MRNSTVRRALMGAMLSGGLKPADSADVSIRDSVVHIDIDCADSYMPPDGSPDVGNVKIQQSSSFGQSLGALRSLVEMAPKSIDGLSATPDAEAAEKVIKNVGASGGFRRGELVVIAENAEKVIKTAIGNTLAAGGSKVVRQANLRNVQTRLSKSKAAKKKVKTSPLMKLLIKQVT